MKSYFFILLFFLSFSVSAQEEDTCFIYIPNNVSMHCDQAGMDFLLVVQHSCPFSAVHFMVFNRWGEVLHDSHDPEPEFDASKLAQDAYFYRLDVTYQDPTVGRQDGTKQRVEGSFTVLR